MPHIPSLFRMSVTQTAGHKMAVSQMYISDFEPSVLNKQGYMLTEKLQGIFSYSVPIDRALVVFSLGSPLNEPKLRENAVVGIF